MSQEVTPQAMQTALDGEASPKLLALFAGLCNRVGAGADELAAQWEAHAMNHKLSLTESAFKSFEAHLADQQARRPGGAAAAAPRAAFNASTIGEVATPSGFEAAFGAKIAALPATPTNAGEAAVGARRNAPTHTPSNEPMSVPKRTKFAPENLASPGAGGYAERTNAGSLVCEHRPVTLPALTPEGGEGAGADDVQASRCDLEPLEGHVTARYRHMHTSPAQRSAALEARLVRLGEELVAQHGIAEVGVMGVASQQPVTVIGRVCCEAAEGKINKTSVVLEGSRAQCGGRRLPLDLSALQGFALFPGQVIAAEGVNASGRKLVVSRIFDAIPRPVATTPKAQLAAYHRDAQYQSGHALRMLVAAGPFTTSDNLDYAPLDDLAHVVLGTRPDVLLLVGPFVDAAHPAVAENRLAFQAEDTLVELTATELFELKVSSVLATMRQQGLSTKVALVPSLGDVFHDFVYPQPPLDGGALGLSEDSVTLLPNPATFRVNEVVVGVTSVDAVFHTGREEVAFHAQDRLGRMCNHLVQQQSFYPLFPPAAVGDSPAQLDLNRLAEVGMPVTPDVLVVPSRLNQFAKQVGSTLCVNPGSLAKGVSGGSFASVAVHPPAQTPEEVEMAMTGDDAETEVPHEVPGRTVVQVLRI